MLRAVITFLVLASIASAIGFQWYREDRALHQRLQTQISELDQESGRLRGENDRLKAALAKVEQEQNRLVGENQKLLKELEKGRLTGKILPAYPPK